MEILFGIGLALMLTIVLFWKWQDHHPPKCSTCGRELEHFEGMGAGFDRCMKCDPFI